MSLIIKTCLLGFLSLFLISCSSRPIDGLANHASDNGTTSTTTSPGTSANKASCNQFSANSNLVGKVKAYYVGGTYRSDMVRVRLTGIPDGFANADDVFIEFYRWRVSPNGAVEQDPTPLRFRFENGSTLIAGSTTYGPTGSGTNVGFNRQALFTATGSQNIGKLTEYNFLVQGTDAALGYQVLRASLTSSGNGSSMNISYADMLIPFFEANPNTYAASHAAVLNQLHPNWTRRTEGWTDTNYVAFTTQLCF